MLQHICQLIIQKHDNTNVGGTLLDIPSFGWECKGRYGSFR